MTIEQRIRDRVAAIPEPCAIALGRPTTLGQMGLIDCIAFADGHATVTLCLTNSACVHFRAMQQFVADVFADMPEVTSVSVDQTPTELWTPDRMVA